MSTNPIDSVKGYFNRNQNENSSNKEKIKQSKKSNVSHKSRMNPKIKNINQNQKNILNQRQNVQNPQKELSEMDNVLLRRMNEIENVISKLVADVQYLDSKNLAVSSKTKGILVELITNLWIIGNIAINYQKNNQLSIVSQYLLKHEEELLNMVENIDEYDVDEEYDFDSDLNDVRLCQKIIDESLRPINSTIEYYNILMLKLSNWGFEVKDPIGQKYDAHMDIDVLAFEDQDPNLEVHTITETKKPEIYLNGDKILKAQVIVTKASKKNKTMKSPKKINRKK